MRRWLALGILLGGFCAVDASAQSAQRWQTSYDREATGDIAGALTALRGLAESERGYLYEVRRGWLFYLLARHDESVASYRRAIQLKREAVEPRVGLLLPLMALRRWQETEQVARAALRIDRDNHLASRRLALALYYLGRFEDAARVYQRVLTLHPSDLDMQEGLGWCALRRGRVAEARRHFEGVLAVAPNHTGAAAGLAATARSPVQD